MAWIASQRWTVLMTGPPPFRGRPELTAHLDPRFAGTDPVGHGYAPDSVGANRMYYTFPVAEGVLGISLDTTNRAGRFVGSLGTAQLRWLERTLKEQRDSHVLVLSGFLRGAGPPDPVCALRECAKT